MRRIVAAGAALALVALWYRRERSDIEQPGGSADAESIIDGVSDMIGVATSAVTPFSLAIALPGNLEYVNHINRIERERGIPENLMTRIAWQECRFRADIISGRVRSSAGAAGMWQLMPIHWTYVDPLNWKASAEYAADMMVRLYGRFGTWALALAAYNWGEGNLSRKGIAAAPRETRNYYAQILGDLGMAVTV